MSCLCDLEGLSSYKRTMPFPKILLFSLLLLSIGGRAVAAKKAYVVYLGSHPHSRNDIIDHERITDGHHELLASVVGSKEKAKDVVFQSYTKFINGFAANLEAEEARELARHPDVVSVFPNRGRKMQGDIRLARYLGLQDPHMRVPVDSLWSKAEYGRNIVIGAIDTGVISEEENFDDKGYEPIPLRWKGICQNDTLPLEEGGVRCNRKLIGARYFSNGVVDHVNLMRHENETAWDAVLKLNYFTPRGKDYHGTSALSLAGSRPISGVYAGSERPAGTVQGTAPAARLASYKVCYVGLPDNWECLDADILAAFDEAIHDGVDVITVSLGSNDWDVPAKGLIDAVSIGSFHALLHGIPTVACQGNLDNETQDYRFQVNAIPWVLSVGASHMNKQYLAKMTLGNNNTIVGASLYDADVAPLPDGEFFPLTNFRLIGNKGFEFYCRPGTFDPDLAKGKIVLCMKDDVNATLNALREAGAVGAIIVQMPLGGYPFMRFGRLPNVEITFDDYKPAIFNYSFKDPNPVASFTRTYVRIGKPYVLYFSTPGPNKNNPEILKPDVVAPGFVFDTTTNGLKNNLMIGGTSFSTPITAGVVALLRSIHPDWSPAAIKSALMTTANRVTKRIVAPTEECMAEVPPNRLIDSTPLDAGAGLINPNAAADPGLVYDITVDEYLDFMCLQGFSSELIAKFALRPYSCPCPLPRVIDFNYPAIVVPDYNQTVAVNRRLKNVGPPGTYHVSLRMPPNVKVKVEPMVLSFAAAGEERTFTVSFTATGAFNLSHGSMTWSDGAHRVTSPLVVWVKSHEFLPPGDPSYGRGS